MESVKSMRDKLLARLGKLAMKNHPLMNLLLLRQLRMRRLSRRLDALERVLEG